MKCSICRRDLNDYDIFGIDCGGDCAVCMIEAEILVKDFTTAQNILNDVYNRLKRLINEEG